MKIVVAGAGAGKTTSMAQKVLDRLNQVTDGKIIYVITYTNAARNHIREKIIEICGSIPKQLLIETSHVFLQREFIFPFHHLLYDQQYIKASQIKLPDNHGFKALKIKELKKNKIIHVEKVTETAKWIVSGKSGDKKSINENRQKIIALVLRYLDSVFIDEAQDIDEHLVKIIEVLNDKGINMCLVGDPKQDLRGKNAFKQMVYLYKQHVEYISENHRSPISHVNFSNLYIVEEERQIPQSFENGKLAYLFESSIKFANFIDEDVWDYKYIYKKNDRFITHTTDQHISEQNLAYELKFLVKKSNISDNEVDKYVYVLKKWIIKNLDKKHNYLIFNKLQDILGVKLSKQEKGKLWQVLDWNRERPMADGYLVNSLDSVKGLEGDKCLFILTTDLADYLFFEKNHHNKMMNYLYVALSRSKKELLILISTEVESKYGKEAVINIFRKLKIPDYYDVESIEKNKMHLEVRS